MTIHKSAERTSSSTDVGIRAYRPENLREMLRVFHEAVHRGCTGAYSPEQLAAWAPKTVNEKAWARRFAETIDLIAKGMIDPTRYVTEVLPLEGLQHAFERQTDPNDPALKFVIKP